MSKIQNISFKLCLPRHDILRFSVTWSFCCFLATKMSGAEGDKMSREIRVWRHSHVTRR